MKWPSSVKPLMARAAISPALREPVCAAGTASMIAFSASGMVTALARKPTARLVMPVASRTVMARSLPISGKPLVAMIWRRAISGSCAEAPMIASMSG